MRRACRLVLPVTVLALAAAPARAQDPTPPEDDPGVVVLQPDDGEPGLTGDDPAGENPDLPAVPPVVATDPKVTQKTNKKAISATPRLTGPTVRGLTAMMRSDGTAVPPAAAPIAVKRMIWTANRMIGRRYRWGGGHRSFADSSYDCSGAVSYALHAAALLDWPMVSGELATWGRAGAGRWVTIYANRTHVYMTVAGLRLDTSPVADPGGLSGPRWRPVWRPSARFHRRHPPGL